VVLSQVLAWAMEFLFASQQDPRIQVNHALLHIAPRKGVVSPTGFSNPVQHSRGIDLNLKARYDDAPLKVF
jgi:hypothetical protein